MSISSLKLHLERYCKVASWSPTPAQLLEIAIAIREQAQSAKPLTVSRLQTIIIEKSPGVRFHLLEGADNSDLATLLVLAKNTADANKPNK